MQPSKRTVSSNARLLTLLTVTSLYLSGMAGCSGGNESSTAGTDTSGTNCNGNCASASSVLSVADVQRIVSQAVFESQAQGANATIAVVDRVGNVLAVYRMGSAATRRVTLATALNGANNPVLSGGLEGIRLPVVAAPLNIDDQAAIAKAITGAYLSSEGNAFSTRTASQIVQEHFNPSEDFQPSGPLFGVQFSQLACSDLVSSFNGIGPSVGPQRSPLGLAADAGGFPLYKDGTVVGGVGVMADGVYGLDKQIGDVDRNVDEMIAYAATYGFAAPLDRRADRITADGRTLRFSDVSFDDLLSRPANAPAFASLGAAGALISTTGYFDGTIRTGVAFGQAPSGVRVDTENNFPGEDAFVFVTAANALRYAPRAGTDAGSIGGAVLTQAEVRQLLRSSLHVANNTRAQIRRPLGSQARVTISVVDTHGEVLGVVRTRDAPMFGADVSLQKARTAAFFSGSNAGAFLTALPNAKYLTLNDATASATASIAIGGYVTASQSFLGDSFNSGSVAYSARAIGNLARPFYADGINGAPAGPLSKSIDSWSVLSTGLQLDVAQNAILQHVLHVAGAPLADVSTGCAGVNLADNLSTATPTVTSLRVANGLQIFPGGVPIYRNGTLIGAIGVSGDGVDQDDMIAFLGLHQAGITLSGAIGNAALARRADILVQHGVRLRYVQCPQAPFLDSASDNVCEAK